MYEIWHFRKHELKPNGALKRLSFCRLRQIVVLLILRYWHFGIEQRVASKENPSWISIMKVVISQKLMVDWRINYWILHDFTTNCWLVDGKSTKTGWFFRWRWGDPSWLGAGETKRTWKRWSAIWYSHKPQFFNGSLYMLSNMKGKLRSLFYHFGGDLSH